MQNMQTFIWGRPTQVVDERQYYEGFNLNGTDYRLGDTVMLYAESEQQQNYVGRLEAAFCSLAPGSSADPYCVQLKWYERLTNLESRSQCCPGKERELAELEEMDINPIGCISGKCTVLHTRSYEEALQLAGQVCDGPWFFCRGVYHPDTKQVVPRSQGGGLLSLARLHDGVKRRKAGAAVEDVGDSEDMRCSKRPQRGRSGSPLRNVQSSLESSVPLDSLTSEGETQRPSARGRKTSMAAPVGSTADAKGIVGNGSNNSSATSTNPPARCCVECGATHTPQWREGPMGPKTLCNACGVRYGRQQNRAGKRIGGAGVSRAAAMRAAPAVAASAAGGHAKPSAFKGTKCEKESAAQYELATAASSGVRPVRQAAMLAANRNAEFARTGMYPDTEDARANSSSLVRQPSRRADTGVAMEELQPLSPQQQQVLAGVAMSRAASQHQQEAQQHADSVLCQQAAQQPMPPAMLHPLPGPAQATTPPAAPILAPLGKAASMGKSAGRLPASMSAAAAELRMMPRDSPNNSDDSAQDVLGVLDDAMGEQQQQQLLEQWYGPEAQQIFSNSAAGAFTGGRPNLMDAQLAMLPGMVGAHATGMSRSGSKARAAEQAKIAAVIGHSGADAAAVLALKPTGGRVSVNSGGGGSVGLLQCKQESAEHHAVASHKMAAAAHQEGAQPAAQDGSSGAAAAAPVDLQQLVQRATRWVPNSMQQDTSTLLSSFELLRHRLLPHEVARLLSVGQAVETAANKAVQADAALAAVREVLQHHQGVADKAHAEATSAVSQLRSMMAQLMAHHPELGIPAPASADGMQSGAAQGPAAPHPDLLLSDIAVGDMDGIDSLALLQPSGSEPDLCGVAARVAAAGAGLRGMGADDDDDMILGGLMMGPAAFPHQAHVAQWQQ